MAQPNIAREPSMDEILASIRRIIESNEPPVGAPPVLTAVPNDADDAGSFDDEMIVADFHVEEARYAAQAPATTHSPTPTPAQASVPNPIQAFAAAIAEPEPRPSQPAMSLADVAARVRAASERNGMLLREQDTRPAAHPEQAEMRGESPFGSLSEALSTPMSAGGVSDLGGQESAGHIAQPAADPFVTSQPAYQEQQHYREPQPAQATTEVAEPGPLVSPAVGAQVASSFGALAKAVEAGPRRSFDEIAAEMLRPMLQEWLDDNLPTLVERLVREEIERVARGPRR